MPLDKPGVYDLPAEVYHADCAPAPSLSSSIAHILIDQSPRHAWAAHPRLNPDFQPEHRAEFDLGAAVHSLVLQGDESRFAVVEADSYRTKAAQEARAEAYAAGRIPLLPHQRAQVSAVADAVLGQIAAHSEACDAFQPTTGEPERTLLWQEGDVWLRAMVDWLPTKPRRGQIVYDLKTTTNAEPDAWARSKIGSMGYDVQAAFYLRGLRALGYPELRFAFVVAEMDPPHAVSVVGLAPALIAQGAEKVEVAVNAWRRCLASGQWPAYPNRICWVEPQPWEGARWLERMTRDERPGAQALDTARRFQAPLGAAE